MFNNMSIRTSLLFVVGVLIGMLVIVGAGCMLVLSTSNRSVTLAEADMTSADALTSAYSSLLRARAAFDACDRQFGNGDLDASKISLTNGRSLVGAANESWTRFRNAISDSPQSDADSSVIRAYGDLMDSTLSPAVRALASSDMVEYRSLVAGPMDAAFARLDKSVAAVVSARKARAAEMFQTAQRHAGFVRGLLAGSLVLSLLLAVGAIRIVNEKVTRPLAIVIGVMDKLASGDLTEHIDSQAIETETGRLNTSLLRMQVSLIDIVRTISRNAESIDLGAREIATGNSDLSVRTEEQAASLEETAASMTQLTQTVTQNADSARQANSLVNNATDLADVGNNAVQAMVGTIEEISGSSSKISEITGMIEGIAFQTNILALNAAVEAARAGEQGRGFAVVASEVRSLAQRSAAAAKEIKTLISSSVSMIQDGSRQAVEVGATMARLRHAIQQVSDIVGEIASASEEQSRGITQISQAVTQMDEVTQRNAALVEQAAAAAQSLEQQAGELRDAVAVFTLAGPAIQESLAMPPPRTRDAFTALPRNIPVTFPPEKNGSRTNADSVGKDVQASSQWEAF
jgi:methyl-accepting chemotaxis protein I, serine sensor receptor